ncbi:MAG: hypothetical protein G01um10147_714 [Microgenomates group bacterium Gr01-1014_7]|nr:MAG: hypothetical protein G01um10147_714 [Microgenomates group bacterium Gr01-1014_7]
MLFKSKKQLLTIIGLLILLIAIPLTMYLARQTQIFKPRATGTAPMEFFRTGTGFVDIGTNAAGTPVSTEPNVKLRLTYP